MGLLRDLIGLAVDSHRQDLAQKQQQQNFYADLAMKFLDKGDVDAFELLAPQAGISKGDLSGITPVLREAIASQRQREFAQDPGKQNAIAQLLADIARQSGPQAAQAQLQAYPQEMRGTLRRPAVAKFRQGAEEERAGLGAIIAKAQESAGRGLVPGEVAASQADTLLATAPVSPELRAKARALAGGKIAGAGKAFEAKRQKLRVEAIEKTGLTLLGGGRGAEAFRALALIPGVSDASRSAYGQIATDLDAVKTATDQADKLKAQQKMMTTLLRIATDPERELSEPLVKATLAVAEMDPESPQSKLILDAVKGGLQNRGGATLSRKKFDEEFSHLLDEARQITQPENLSKGDLSRLRGVGMRALQLSRRAGVDMKEVSDAFLPMWKGAQVKQGEAQAKEATSYLREKERVSAKELFLTRVQTEAKTQGVRFLEEVFELPTWKKTVEEITKSGGLIDLQSALLGGQPVRVTSIAPSSGLDIASLKDVEQRLSTLRGRDGRSVLPSLASDPRILGLLDEDSVAAAREALGGLTPEARRALVEKMVRTEFGLAGSLADKRLLRVATDYLLRTYEAEEIPAAAGG